MINILVVEDNKDKREHINSVITSTGLDKSNIINSKNVMEAIQQLKSKQFEIMVLDLKLPIRGTTPKDNAGLTILEQIQSGQIPSPKSVIGLTSFSDLKNNSEKQFIASDISLYDISKSDDWIEALKGKIAFQKGANANQKVNSKKKVIVTVHGINTAGRWQNSLEKALGSNNNFVFKPYKYIHKAPFKILIPIWRKRVLSAFERDLKQLVSEHPEGEFYFFAHSFGSYILANALKKMSFLNAPNIRLVTLAGTVLKRNFNWAEIKKELSVDNIVNDCGVNDGALPFAYLFAPGLGMAGRTGFYGFKEGVVLNRYYDGGHSFFEESETFYREYWLPLVTEDKIKTTGHSDVEPNELLEIIFDSAKWILYGLVLLLVFYSFFSIGTDLVNN
jgi:CheY-like chemotaxis protein